MQTKNNQNLVGLFVADVYDCRRENALPGAHRGAATRERKRNDNLRITCIMLPVIANIDRVLRLPLAGKEMFFLWGPRQTGITHCLKKRTLE